VELYLCSPTRLHGVDRDNFVFKVRGVPVKAMKACGENGATAIVILNLGTLTSGNNPDAH